MVFIFSIILVLGVVFVNGWTDAPNAIGTAVGTRVLTPRNAIIVGIIFNFLGVLLMTLVSPEVAETISTMVTFDSINPGEPMIALCAALIAIVTWATVAWYFGIPTSESHALIAGITGSALAIGGLGAINMSAWVKVLIGLGLSSVLGFGGGYFLSWLITVLFKNARRNKAGPAFVKAEAGAACAMAFLHGAQDGQKFMGVFMLALFMNGMVDRNVHGVFDIPIWVMLLCSVVMGVGTGVGGWRIIKTIGVDMVKMEPYQAFASDAAAAGCLLIATLTGMPVSTTHTKTTAIMGVGAARRRSSVDWGIVREMIMAWVLTFPGCGLIGFIFTKIFLAVF
jgi:PiT family inorganic phosphate transporter